MRDPGNALDRGPAEHFTSPPIPLEGACVTAVEVDADVPDGTSLSIEVRVASSPDALESADWGIAPTAPAAWLQYRASFVSQTGASSPRLRGVSLELEPSSAVP
jgi:hypothetical protein